MLMLAIGALIIVSGALLAATIQLASRRRERDYAMEEAARLRRTWLATDKELAEACRLLRRLARSSTTDQKEVNDFFLRNGGSV